MSSGLCEPIRTSAAHYPVCGRICSAAAFRAGSRRHYVDAEARHDCLGILVSGHRALPQQAHRAAAHGTNEFARGNLDIRVSHYIGNRRDEIADLVRDFDSMADELRKPIQSERNLLSGVSHELRSPDRAHSSGSDPGPSVPSTRTPRRCSTASSRTPSSSIPCWRRSSPSPGWKVASTSPTSRLLSLNDIIDDVLDDARFEATATDVDITFTGSADVDLSAAILVYCAVRLRTSCATLFSIPARAARSTSACDVTMERRCFRYAIMARACRRKRCRYSSSLSIGLTIRAELQQAAWDLGLAIVRNAVLVHGGTITAQNVVPHGLQIDILCRLLPLRHAVSRRTWSRLQTMGSRPG